MSNTTNPMFAVKSDSTTSSGTADTISVGPQSPMEADIVTRTEMADLINVLKYGLSLKEKYTKQDFDLKHHLLSSEDKFRGKNVTDFLMLLEDTFDAYNVQEDVYRIQAITRNYTSNCLTEIKTLLGYEDKDY